MKKRDFLGTALVGAAAIPLSVNAAEGQRQRSPALLTVTGAVGKSNRGPLDPVLDQMMAKQKIAFQKAYAFTFDELAGMKATTIKPTLEYDKKAHELRGPLLTDVLKVAGVASDGVKLAMRAVDGYSPVLPMADAKKYRFIVATHLDGKPMPLGGLGPLWAVYDADRFPDMAAKPVDQRFALCPWALYHIDVQG
ncbi:MAG TPA: molybdopterin-dependent oxidoreductase [Ramlibacter sp.]|nr:molybdopterin-dependent oxidoreductase [Ramlibacter sp.]